MRELLHKQRCKNSPERCRNTCSTHCTQDEVFGNITATGPRGGDAFAPARLPHASALKATLSSGTGFPCWPGHAARGSGIDVLQPGMLLAKGVPGWVLGAAPVLLGWGRMAQTVLGGQRGEKRSVTRTGKGQS